MAWLYSIKVYILVHFLLVSILLLGWVLIFYWRLSFLTIKGNQAKACHQALQQ